MERFGLDADLNRACVYVIIRHRRDYLMIQLTLHWNILYFNIADETYIDIKPCNFYPYL